ncbi:rRNA small subunit methyltransferase B [Dactylosporangium fulvum]|uniref:rRNA small subunit methyltransferase B n=1 Tax=Dactylosporangium fulvum TaxID=53359 RepID=A0ABY5VV30_9ACTN|nr:transcription antitermination factor NusB [Dactylosporangium fulvum]UWP80686.1 rRNA small subunit methyltransferase B [Dactylosporangium fulvum]
MRSPRRGPGARPAGGRDDRLARPPRGGRPAIDPAREAAYEAVAAVHRDDAYANLVLPRILRESGVSGRDAAFATELTYGTLRQTGTLDAIVAAAADRPVDRIDPPVRDALRVGAYQLLHMRVGAHAAVATTVDLVRSLVPGAAGFANAVLRRIAEADRSGWLARLAPADPVARAALTHAHPEWIVRAFVDALGSLDEAELALDADNLPPPVHLCARPGLLDPADLAAALPGASVGRYSPYAVVLTGGGDPGAVPAVRDGRAHVQDEGSQLVAAALAGAPLDGRDDTWLDLCAGPGGKAGLLGALAAQRGAHVTAVEIAHHRAALVAQATAGLPVYTINADGRDVGKDPDLPAGGFDRVLVDAPCTGLGALRRRPEARWRRQPSDLPPLTRLQRELLQSAFRAVRPGGLVAYVTCSPHQAETEVSVTEAARRSDVDVDLVDVRPYLPSSLPEAGTGPTVQLWPHRHGTDAMFVALLRRAA